MEPNPMTASAMNMAIACIFLPQYMRCSSVLAQVLSILYLAGSQTVDFRPALESLLGEDTASLSPTNLAADRVLGERIHRLSPARSERTPVSLPVGRRRAFQHRLEDDQLCTLVMIGALPNGEKELLGRGWLSAKRRELEDHAARAQTTRDGCPDAGARRRHAGFWAAAREVWPGTREQGCWCHKLVNVLDKLPRRL
jgi:hypothetical protein